MPKLQEEIHFELQNFTGYSGGIWRSELILTLLKSRQLRGLFKAPTLAGSVNYGSGGEQVGGIPPNIPPTCFFPAKQQESGKSVFIGLFMDEGRKALILRAFLRVAGSGCIPPVPIASEGIQKLKIRCQRWRVGSSPTTGTNQFSPKGKPLGLNCCLPYRFPGSSVTPDTRLKLRLPTIPLSCNPGACRCLTLWICRRAPAIPVSLSDLRRWRTEGWHNCAANRGSEFFSCCGLKA